MAGFLLRRAVGAAGLLLAASFVVFSLLHIAPGDPIDILIGRRQVDPETIAAMRREFGLDLPFFEQYLHWLGRAVQGDLGTSVQYRSSVVSVLSGRVAITLELAAFAGVLVVVLGMGIGILTALRRGTVDAVGSLALLAGASVAPYVSGLLLISLFAVKWQLAPVFGAGAGFSDRLVHLVLPACALAIALTALVGRVTRAAMITALEQEFVETARSRGLPLRHVVLKHALRSALIPVVTITGVVVGYLISGAVLVEYTFGLGGLGSLLVDAVQARDFVLVQAIVLIFTASFILLNLLADLLYFVVDPRIRPRAA